MKKNMYSVLHHFFLFVCLVIPLHTTANAANTTDDCLQILTSDFAGNSAKEFIGTQHLLSLIHISEPTRRTPISYAVFCLKKKKKKRKKKQEKRIQKTKKKKQNI